MATPIGNLGDISIRAIETLKEAGAVIAEDTRRARILFERYQIHSPLISMPAFREREQADELVAKLREGMELVLITDAGSPGISDPGTFLVQRAIEFNIPIIPIPGPCAWIAALSASGLSTERSYCVGFLPRKGPKRNEALSTLKRLAATIVLFESPERLRNTLRELRERFGDRHACVARELTKKHEEFIRGTFSELLNRMPDPVRGEVTLVIEGLPELQNTTCASNETLQVEISKRLASEKISLRDLAKELSEDTGRSRNEIYALALNIRQNEKNYSGDT